MKCLTLYSVLFTLIATNACAHGYGYNAAPEDTACYQQGFLPDTDDFNECRARVQDAMAQAAYDANLRAQTGYYTSDLYTPLPMYEEERHEHHHRHNHWEHDRDANPNVYYDEYGRRCKKTHRGWILCK